MKIGPFQFALLVLLFSSIGASQLAGQSVPRTADGRPDLQGVWDFRTMTPLQRPTDLGDQAFLTAEEASAQEASVAQRRAQLLEPSEARSEPLPAGGGGRAVGGYNDFWLDYGTTVIDDRRTSLIVDPENGRLLALTTEGEALRQVGSSLITDLPIESPIRVRSAGTGADHP